MSDKCTVMKYRWMINFNMITSKLRENDRKKMMLLRIVIALYEKESILAVWVVVRNDKRWQHDSSEADHVSQRKGTATLLTPSAFWFLFFNFISKMIKFQINEIMFGEISNL